ncbi:MAG TPA: hypothetical protein VM327_04180 [Candidatus Thermoplasmatota archaeon]|nr:hypothetical protein [Candidatus Thermoplasmatota archaeon]
MDGRGVAWLSYLPLPGLALVPVLMHPGDRLARYHAWQGGVLVGGLWILMTVFALLILAIDARPFRAGAGFLAGLLLVGSLVQMVWGAVSSALGRYARLRPAWDLAAALRREP